MGDRNGGEMKIKRVNKPVGRWLAYKAFILLIAAQIMAVYLSEAMCLLSCVCFLGGKKLLSLLTSPVQSGGQESYVC